MDTETLAETKCHRGKVCKNLRGLMIHRAWSGCGREKQQAECTVNTSKTEEDHSQDEHHSAEDLLPPETAQASIKEEQVNFHTLQADAEPSTATRKLVRNVHMKIASLETMVATVGLEWFGMVSDKEQRETTRWTKQTPTEDSRIEITTITRQ